MEPLAPTIRKSVIIFGDDGLPALSSEPVLTKQHIRALYFVVAAQPYVVEDPLHPDFGKYDGLTYAEVLVRKEIEGAAKSGDVASIEKVMDRLIDKAIAHSENTTVHKTYEDKLKEIRARVIDVKAEPPPPASVFGDLE